jgi:LPXTG-site transpeptidase (sortase) family protein
MDTAAAHIGRWQSKLSKEQIRIWFGQIQSWANAAWVRLPANKSTDRSRAARQYFGSLLISLGALLSTYVVGTYGWMYQQQITLLHQWQSANSSSDAHVSLTEGTPLTRIQIPRIKLDAVITEGVSQHALRLGPGHLQYSAIPGEIGNSVIAAHRDSFFRHIYELKAGDDIYVERLGKQFHYVVTGKRVVQPSDVSVLDNSSEARLTLITCYPIHYIGPAPERLVVVAKLAEQA